MDNIYHYTITSDTLSRPKVENAPEVKDEFISVIRTILVSSISVVVIIPLKVALRDGRHQETSPSPEGDNAKELSARGAAITGLYSSANPPSEATVTFLYDPEDNVLRVSMWTGTDLPIFREFLTIEKTYEFIKHSFSTLKIVSKTLYQVGWADIDIATVRNYSKMITDLEKAGKLTTRKVESGWYGDDRFFTLLPISNESPLGAEDPYSESGIEWSVGYLGTRIAEGLTSWIVKLWSSLPPTARSEPPAPELGLTTTRSSLPSSETTPPKTPTSDM